ncbi:unnamed protein product [Ilex paraguariensis]|uniref:Uncharacterized protein n=1 Tax=Ilex paraguariensis TaxID=185542 RepID=A0ABC8TB80_9AQUA
MIMIFPLSLKLRNKTSALNLELLSRAEKLELTPIERDLSTQATETASKQHLASIKNVTKLETECRYLKAMAHKVSPANDHRFMVASSVHLEYFTDNLADSMEGLLAFGHLL